jgi:hypothetical protein
MGIAISPYPRFSFFLYFLPWKKRKNDSGSHQDVRSAGALEQFYCLTPLSLNITL